MPKKKHRSSKHSSRGSGHPARRSSRQRVKDDRDLIGEAEEALAAAHPLPMLELASALLNLLDTRNNDPLDRSVNPERPSLSKVLSTFTASEEPAAAALAWTMANMSGDDLVRTRVVRDLGARSFLLPSWMHQMSKIEVVAAEQLTDTVGDSYNLVVHVRLAGHDLTAVPLIDFNLGAIVKENFFSDKPLETFNQIWKEHADTGHTALEAMSPADARVWISDAIETGARTWPPAESEWWPATRPLLEWILRQLPEGGTGFVRPEWSEEDREALANRFLTSSYGAALDLPDDRSIVGDLIWYRADYGYGDPLRWSPTAIEILMLDWYPRKIMAEQRYLRRMPIVLRDFVRFVHSEAGLDDETTVEALEAVDEYEYEYREAIGKPRRQGPEAILEAMGALDPLDDGDDFDDDDLEDENSTDPDALKMVMLELLADQVGGHDQLVALTDEPLGDEPFDWNGLPNEVHDRVGEVLGLCDDCCDQSLDVEQRTAVRRLLHDVVIADPSIFSSGSQAKVLAAALCSMVARANESASSGRSPARDLMHLFGLSSTPDTEVDSMRTAIGADATEWQAWLGSARYLTGARRRSIITYRDQALESV